jgi:superfamily II DNA or RNA helicase
MAPQSNKAMPMNLRPYQTDLITAIRLQYQLGHRKVLAVLPTGAGKWYD